MKRTVKEKVISKVSTKDVSREKAWRRKVLRVFLPLPGMSGLARKAGEGFFRQFNYLRRKRIETSK